MYAVGVDIGVRRVTLACARAFDHKEFGWTDEKDLGKPWIDRHRELMELASFAWHSIAQNGLAHHEVVLIIEKTYASHGGAQNPSTTIALTQTATAVMTAASWADVLLVVPSTWKAKVIGNGHADKQEIAAYLENHHPDLWVECAPDQDRVDAMCMSLYGRGRMAGEILAPETAPKKRTRKAV